MSQGCIVVTAVAVVAATGVCKVVLCAAVLVGQGGRKIGKRIVSNVVECQMGVFEGAERFRRSFPLDHA